MPNTGMKMRAMIQAIAVDGLRLPRSDRRDQDDQDVGTNKQMINTDCDIVSLTSPRTNDPADIRNRS